MDLRTHVRRGGHVALEAPMQDPSITSPAGAALALCRPAPAPVAPLRYWSPAAEAPSRLLCGEFDGASCPANLRDELQLLVADRALVVTGASGRAHDVPADAVALLNAHERVRVRSADRRPVRTLVVFVPAAWFAGGVVPWFPVPVVRDAALAAPLRSAVRALRAFAPPAATLPSLRLALAALERRHAVARDAAGGTLPLERVRRWLVAHRHERVALEELGAIAALSRYHLLRAFRRRYGATPRDYQMLLRLATALRLVAAGRPLSHASFDAGFADQSHMTRAFRQHVGLTPLQYARQCAAPWHPVPAAPPATARREAHGDGALPRIGPAHQQPWPARSAS